MNADVQGYGSSARGLHDCLMTRESEELTGDQMYVLHSRTFAEAGELHDERWHQRGVEQLISVVG